jgi:hypothetical protein
VVAYLLLYTAQWLRITFLVSKHNVYQFVMKKLALFTKPAFFYLHKKHVSICNKIKSVLYLLYNKSATFIKMEHSMIYFILLFMMSAVCSATPQTTQSILQQIAHNSSVGNAPQYPAQHTISYKFHTRPYTLDEIVKIREYHELVNNYDKMYKNLFTLKNILNVIPSISDSIDPQILDEKELLILKNNYTTTSSPLLLENKEQKKINPISIKILSLGEENIIQLRKDITEYNQQILSIQTTIDTKLQELNSIEKKRYYVTGHVQPKSQLPYQEKKNPEGFLYKLVARQEEYQQHKRHEMQIAHLKNYIDQIIDIPTLEEYRKHLDNKDLNLLEKSLKTHEFIVKRNILHTAKKILLKNPTIIFTSEYEHIDDKIKHLFNIIVQELEYQS